MGVFQANGASDSNLFRRLNNKHLEILFLICKGLRNAEIASQLQLSERTIKGYVTQLFLIFDATNRTELAGIAFETNILQTYSGLPEQTGSRRRSLAGRHLRWTPWLEEKFGPFLDREAGLQGGGLKDAVTPR